MGTSAGDIAQFWAKVDHLLLLVLESRSEDSRYQWRYENNANIYCFSSLIGLIVGVDIIILREEM